MIELYIFIIGVILAFISILEFFLPYKAFQIWSRYVSSKAFFLHGLLLIGGGFPLVMYQGTLSTIIFIIGIVVILTGPFILLYPEKINGMFVSIESEMDIDSKKRFIYFDASARFIIGGIFVLSYFL